MKKRILYVLICVTAALSQTACARFYGDKNSSLESSLEQSGIGGEGITLNNPDTSDNSFLYTGRDFYAPDILRVTNDDNFKIYHRRKWQYNNSKIYRV